MTGLFQNRLREAAVIGQPEPVVGMGVTLTYWTDRGAGTVIEVVNAKTIRVQKDRAVDPEPFPSGYYGGTERDPHGTIFTFTLRKNGRWTVKGQAMGATPGLQLGVREPYRDPHF